MGETLEKRFTQAGFPKPIDYNIADWILQVTQVYSIEDLTEAGFFEDESKGIDTNDNIKSSRKARRNASYAAKQAKVVKHVGLLTQTRLLFKREINNVVRDKASLLARVGSTLIFGLLFGLIFLSVGR